MNNATQAANQTSGIEMDQLEQLADVLYKRDLFSVASELREIAHRLRLRRATPPQVADAPILTGLAVSVDVSTGDTDAGHRIFAELTGEFGSDGKTLLAVETSRNFVAAQVADASRASPQPVADVQTPSAVQYRGAGNFAAPRLPDWMWKALESGTAFNDSGDLMLKTPTGVQAVAAGDWIIRDGSGELRRATQHPSAAPQVADDQALSELWMHEDMHDDQTQAILNLPRKELKQYFVQARADVSMWKRRALTAEATLAQQAGAPAQAQPDLIREALQLMVDRFGPMEGEYIFSKRNALQKARAALSASPSAPAVQSPLVQTLNKPARLDAYVRQLAMSVWRTHYSAESPKFELLDDTYGVLTQLDNMLTGLVRALAVQAEPTLYQYRVNPVSGSPTSWRDTPKDRALWMQANPKVEYEEDGTVYEVRTLYTGAAPGEQATTASAPCDCCKDIRDAEAIYGDGPSAAPLEAHAGAVDAISTFLTVLDASPGPDVLFAKDAPPITKLRAAIAASQQAPAPTIDEQKGDKV